MISNILLIWLAVAIVIGVLLGILIQYGMREKEEYHLLPTIKRAIKRALVAHEPPPPERDEGPSILDCLNQGFCPDCGCTEFLKGPQGGMATNIQCRGCGSWFNVMLPYYAERIKDDRPSDTPLAAREPDPSAPSDGGTIPEHLSTPRPQLPSSPRAVEYPVGKSRDTIGGGSQ